MEDEENNNLNMYFKDILLISKYLHNGNKIEENSIENTGEKSIYKFCNKEKYFNKRGTKIINEEEFKNLILILYEYTIFDDFIFLLFEKLNIYLIKVVINGYINYNINHFQQKILSIIQRLLPLMLKNDFIYFIYGKLSKIFRLQLNDNENKENIKSSFERFKKIFEIWKMIFNYGEYLKINEKYIILFGKNNIKIKINNINEKYEGTLININFVKSPLLNINNNIDDFSLLTIYNSKENFFVIKIKDIFKNNDIKVFNINSISFIINDNTISYIINNNKNDIKEIKMDNLNNKEINRIEIMKNFYGKILPIEFIRKYNNKYAIFYRINPDKFDIDINIEYKIETFPEQYKILSEDKWPYINENIEINLDNNLFSNMKYYPKKEYFMKNFKYFGGLEAFFPLFKIIKFYSRHIEDKNIIINIIKDILETIINKIHISKYNLNNFYKIIIPLTGSLKSISDDLSTKEKEILFKNNTVNILYIYILIAPIPNLAKDIFKEVIQIPDDILILDINYGDNIFQQNLSKVDSLDWYCFILFAHFEINILIYDDINKVSKDIFEQFSKIIFSVLHNTFKFNDFQKRKILVNISFLAGILNYVYPNSLEGFKEFNSLKEFSKFINNETEQKEDLSFICLLIFKIFLDLNNLKLIKNKSEGSFYNKFYELLLDIKNIFKINESDKENQKNYKLYLKDIHKNHLKSYIENKSFISEILEENIEFISHEELKLEEFIDYKRQYRKLIKEQFMFNHFWSNKKLFFDEETKIQKLKYKQKNYYTLNFQRPILYPVLDYKYQYPLFRKFSVGDKFYSTEEIKDDYNFNLESKSFDDIIERYWKNNFEKIENELSDKIVIYDACLIKVTHHIKGKIFFEKKEKIKNFYFISYSYMRIGDIPSCNSNGKNKDLCYGAIFHCPEKDCCLKLKININDIRLLMKRIYFYRKSGLEIFTKNKSYYFNFAENPLMKNYVEKIGEKNCEEFFSLIYKSFSNEPFPISNNNQIIGSIDLYTNELRDKDGNLRKSKKKTFMDYFLRHWRDKDYKYSRSNIDISTFDLIIILNLISNRSYNDIYQYPIFPLLYFYDKKIIKDKDNSSTSFSLIVRNLSNHIGFQTGTESSINRKKSYISLNKLKLEDKVECSINKNVCYFSTHYSNGLYTSNFLIRINPYSFIAIEFQGDGFDTPNRLFHSIENSFYTISYFSTDIRELIPEFYYLPEMMINLNQLNLGTRSNGKKVDNVNMPSEFNELNKGENYEIFKFIEFMKNSLEKNFMNLYSWIKLIFGDGQMYNNNKKNELLFRPESYINFDKEDDEKFNKYKKDGDIMNSVEFGLIPLQTIFPYNEIKIDKKRSCIKIIDKIEIEKRMNNTNNFYIANLKDTKKENNIIKEYIFKDNKNNIIKILSNEFGKIQIYKNNIYIVGYYDQKDIIKYINYNKRLNMFITTSLDGYSCLYSFPNKLLNVIKHPNNGYFDYILLGSNPFPFIIAYDKINEEFYSYSLNGIYINKIKISELIQNGDIIKIIPLFDTNGGTHKDILIINCGKNNILINLPFFEKE